MPIAITSEYLVNNHTGKCDATPIPSVKQNPKLWKIQQQQQPVNNLTANEAQSKLRTQVKAQIETLVVAQGSPTTTTTRQRRKKHFKSELTQKIRIICELIHRKNKSG